MRISTNIGRPRSKGSSAIIAVELEWPGYRVDKLPRIPSRAVPELNANIKSIAYCSCFFFSGTYLPIDSVLGLCKYGRRIPYLERYLASEPRLKNPVGRTLAAEPEGDSRVTRVPGRTDGVCSFTTTEIPPPTRHRFCCRKLLLLSCKQYAPHNRGQLERSRTTTVAKALQNFRVKNTWSRLPDVGVIIFFKSRRRHRARGEPAILLGASSAKTVPERARSPKFSAPLR